MSINGRLGQISLKKKRVVKKIIPLKTKKTKILRNYIFDNIEEIDRKIELLWSKYDKLEEQKNELIEQRQNLKTDYNIVDELYIIEKNNEYEMNIRNILMYPVFSYTNLLDFFR